MEGYAKTLWSVEISIFIIHYCRHNTYFERLAEILFSWFDEMKKKELNGFVSIDTGVVHHDDLLYLFCVSFFPYFDENSPEIPTVERMTKIWANFAKTGEPIPRDDEIFSNVTWTPFDVKNKKYLEIGHELVMKTNLHGDRMDQWERLFPLESPSPTTEPRTDI